MVQSKFFLFAIVLFVLGWFMLFQGTQPAGASPLLGITLTPTVITPTRQVPQVTLTPAPVVPTLPPPQPQSTPVIIPVTGSDFSMPAGSLENLGLVLLAFGLIAAGLSGRKK
jgi:hypothetical protein